MIYNLIFKIILFLPIISCFSSIFLNNNNELQKTINNLVYSTVAIGLFVLILGFNANYNLTLLNLNPDISVTFRINKMNLMFGFFLSIIIFFFNEVFQNYFNNLNLSKKYSLYNQSLSILFFLFILFTFSHNIVVSVFLYMLIALNSIFLIKNPELKELKRDYTLLLIISISASMIFIVMSAFYRFYSDNLFFEARILENSSISPFWMLTILFLLILVYFIGPIFLIFRRKLYYEDFLPLFTILIFPFVIINTFLFIKILYYIFGNNFNNIAKYLYHVHYVIILIFLLGCFFLYKNIKNNIKFILLFVLQNYIIFLSQLLLVDNKIDLMKFFTNFLFFAMSTVGAVLLYSGMLFLLLKSGIKDTKILYSKSKIETNLYVFSIFLSVFVNLVSFFTLNFENFNIFYLTNLIGIIILILTIIIYFYFAFIQGFTKIKSDDKKTPIGIKIFEKTKFFKTQTLFIGLFLFLFIFRFLINNFLMK